ncbi:MAG: hypothetical protein GEU96_01320 [Propionibacteriales bacterium]|nr:hypothetical protein [Propionibacteriales bacterium]
MNDFDNLWACIVHVKKPGGDVVTVFVIDARRYADDQAARDVISEAGQFLDDRRVPAEFEYIQVRRDQPLPDLPTWEDYQRQTESVDGREAKP